MNTDVIYDVKLECYWCKKTFTRKRYKVDTEKSFCSKTCQFEWMKVTTEQDRLEKSNKEYTRNCKECNSLFIISPGRRNPRNKNEFCSRKCYMEWRKKNYNVEMFSLVCDICGKEFERTASKDRILIKTRQYICCSTECSLKVARLSTIKNNLWSLLLRAVEYNRYKVNDITPNKLEELWNSQNGCCSYTGEKLILKNVRKKGNKLPNQASIDRIDSSKGYFMDNIEIVSLMANYGKNSFEKKEFIEFCKKVATKHA